MKIVPRSQEQLKIPKSAHRTALLDARSYLSPTVHNITTRDNGPIGAEDGSMDSGEIGTEGVGEKMGRVGRDGTIPPISI